MGLLFPRRRSTWRGSLILHLLSTDHQQSFLDLNHNEKLIYNEYIPAVEDSLDLAHSLAGEDHTQSGHTAVEDIQT
jgi:hypothetical protein